MTSTAQAEEDDRRVRDLVADLLDAVEHALDEAASGRWVRDRRGGVGRVESPDRRRSRRCSRGLEVERELRAAGGRRSRCSRRSASRRRRPPGRCRRCRRGPTGMSPTNSARNSAAVIAPALAPPRLLACRRRSESSSLAVAPLERELPHRLVGRVGRRRRAGRPGPGRCPSRRRPGCRGRACTAPVSVAMSTIASVRLLGRQHERVGHHQPALGVGVAAPRRSCRRGW